MSKIQPQERITELASKEEALLKDILSYIARRNFVLLSGLGVGLVTALMALMFSVSPVGQESLTVISNALGIIVTPLNFLTVSMIVLTVGYSIGPLWFQFHITRAENKIQSIRKEIDDIALLIPETRLSYLQKRFLSVTTRSGRTDWIDNKRREQSEFLRKLVGDVLATLEKIENYGRESFPSTQRLPDWDDAQFMITQWEELLRDEEQELRGERNWKGMSVLIALAYLALLIYAIPYFNSLQTASSYTVFGIPFPIIVWSAVGSLAAILYRFYKSPRRVNFEIEFRWLIARPIIGIIMGALAYLALISGLIVFNTTESAPLDPQKAGFLAQYWIVAFLAGFSDKFYEKIIEWLVGKFTGAQDITESSDKTSRSEKNEPNKMPIQTGGKNLGGSLITSSAQEKNETKSEPDVVDDINEKKVSSTKEAKNTKKTSTKP